MPKRTKVSVETTHFIRDHCLCLHAQRAGRVIARRFDEAFRPLGLTNGQFSLLASLNRPAPATMGSVAAILGMDRTTLTAALKPLQRRGLVEVTADPEDRRSRFLMLTPAGRSLFAAAVPVWETTHAEVERHLAGTDPDLLRRGLRALS